MALVGCKRLSDLSEDLQTEESALEILSSEDTQKSFYFTLDPSIVTANVLLAAVKKWPDIVALLPDEIVTDEVKAYILSLGDYALVKKKHLLYYPEMTALRIINGCTGFYGSSAEECAAHYKFLKANMFNSLGSRSLKRYFVEWIKNFPNLPEQCTYKLKSIGHHDESHKQNPYWKDHLAETSRQRLRVTMFFRKYFQKNGRGVMEFTGATAKQMAFDFKRTIDFLSIIGFNVVVYQQICWRKGLTPCKTNIRDNEDIFDDKNTEIFIINTRIKDASNYEPSKHDGCPCHCTCRCHCARR